MAEVTKDLLPFDVLGDTANEQARMVLDSATDAIARNGYGLTGLRAIARECGCSLAKVYYYFPSKEHLLFAIIARGLHRLCAYVSDEMTNLGADRPQLPELIRATLEYHATHFSEFQVLYHDSNLLGDIFAVAADRIREDYQELVTFAIDHDVADLARELQAHPQGDFELKRIEYYLVGLMSWTLMNRRRVWGEQSDEFTLARVASEIHGIFLHGVASFSRV